MSSATSTNATVSPERPDALDYCNIGSHLDG